MPSGTPVITNDKGRRYIPASAGNRSLDDLDEEAPHPHLRVIRARIEGLHLPQPSPLLEAMDDLLATPDRLNYEIDTLFELDALMRLAIREKVKARRAGTCEETLAVITDPVHYLRLLIDKEHKNVSRQVEAELMVSFIPVIILSLFLFILPVIIYFVFLNNFRLNVFIYNAPARWYLFIPMIFNL